MRLLRPSSDQSTSSIAARSPGALFTPLSFCSPLKSRPNPSRAGTVTVGRDQRPPNPEGTVLTVPSTPLHSGCLGKTIKGELALSSCHIARSAGRPGADPVKLSKSRAELVKVAQQVSLGVGTVAKLKSELREARVSRRFGTMPSSFIRSAAAPQCYHRSIPSRATSCDD
jgi:hypothetical protein